MPPSLGTRLRNRLVLLTASTAFFAGCGNSFDKTQVPTITVTPVIALPLVRIAWTPAGAALVRVYKGTQAGSGYGDALVWSIAASGRNSLQPGVEYGTTIPVGGFTDVAAKPLTPGQPYTVEVTRADPRGTGDGFTNTSNRYVGTRTFTLAATLPAP